MRAGLRLDMYAGNRVRLVERLHHMRRFLVVMVIAVVAGACGGGITHSTDPQAPSRTATTVAARAGLDALAAARARWVASAPTDYTVAQRSWCAGCAAEPATVAVRDGEVVSLVAAETETIDDVFTTIERSIRAGVDVEVEYDEALGYPVRVVIDLDGDGAPDIDLEFGDLEPMPVVETLDELLAAKRLWNAHGIGDYRYIFRADCTCPDGGTFEVEVHNGTVTELRPLDAAAESSDLNPGALDEAFADLADWFTDSSNLIAQGLLAVDVRTDPRYGYPRWFRVEGAAIDEGNFADPFTLVVIVDLVEELEPLEVIPVTTIRPLATERSRLEAAVHRWEQAAVADYSFVLTLHCECAADFAGPHVITVRNGTVESAVLRADGSQRRDVAVSIDELFDMIRLAVQLGSDVIVDYDPDLGYPTDVIIDPEAVAVDGGLALSVSDFDAGG